MNIQSLFKAALEKNKILEIPKPSIKSSIGKNTNLEELIKTFKELTNSEGIHCKGYTPIYPLQYSVYTKAREAVKAAVQKYVLNYENRYIVTEENLPHFLEEIEKTEIDVKEQLREISDFEIYNSEKEDFKRRINQALVGIKKDVSIEIVRDINIKEALDRYLDIFPTQDKILTSILIEVRGVGTAIQFSHEELFKGREDEIKKINTEKEKIKKEIADLEKANAEKQEVLNKKNELAKKEADVRSLEYRNKKLQISLQRLSQDTSENFLEIISEITEIILERKNGANKNDCKTINKLVEKLESMSLIINEKHKNFVLQLIKVLLHIKDTPKEQAVDPAIISSVTKDIINFADEIENDNSKKVEDFKEKIEKVSNFQKLAEACKEGTVTEEELNLELSKILKRVKTIERLKETCLPERFVEYEEEI